MSEEELEELLMFLPIKFPDSAALAAVMLERQLQVLRDSPIKSRARSLAITKLEEAQMWMERAKREEE